MKTINRNKYDIITDIEINWSIVKDIQKNLTLLNEEYVKIKVKLREEELAYSRAIEQNNRYLDELLMCKTK